MDLSIVTRFSNAVGAEKRAWRLLHCACAKIPSRLVFVISQYSSVADDVINGERLFAAMAVSCVSCEVSCTSSSQNFDDGVCYALSQLGLSDLKLTSEQKEAIYAVYSGKDVFVCLPTGFGKSVCCQLLPFLFDPSVVWRCLVGGMKRSCAIIVSPLIALMVDQVRNLRRNGVQAVIISCGSIERSVVGKEFFATDSSLASASHVFSSPEALAHTKWREALENPLMFSRVCAVVVDEAHCVSKWLVLSEEHTILSLLSDCLWLVVMCTCSDMIYCFFTMNGHTVTIVRSR